MFTNLDFAKGSSSLLFIISATKSLYCSKLILWKIFNSTLIVVSYLCNASNFENHFLFLDYLTIFSACSSYINAGFVNSFLIFVLLYEYNAYKSIENAKNAAFITALIKAIIHTYLYVDMLHYHIILYSSIFGIIVYKIRYNLYLRNNFVYHLPLTYAFHLCIMNIMYISSITAV